MIIKSMSRKGGVKKLIEYVNKDNFQQKTLLWNLETNKNNLKKITREFLENKKFIKARKNGVVLYHEVLSFNKLDTKKLTPEILLDIAQEYLAARANTALAYAVPHFNGLNPHVHIIISANEYKSSQKIRISKWEFKHIKQKIEHYQRTKYPDLCHSQINHVGTDKKTKKTRSEREKERRLSGDRGQKLNIKDLLAQEMRKKLFQASSLPEFEGLLIKEGYTLYRRGKTQGIVQKETGKKHRFSTLGIQSLYLERVAQWAKSQDRAREIATIEHEKSQQRWREQGFRAEIIQTLKDPPKTEREQELRRLQSQKLTIQRER